MDSIETVVGGVTDPSDGRDRQIPALREIWCPLRGGVVGESDFRLKSRLAGERERDGVAVGGGTLWDARLTAGRVAIGGSERVGVGRGGRLSKRAAGKE